MKMASKEMVRIMNKKAEMTDRSDNKMENDA